MNRISFKDQDLLELEKSDFKGDVDAVVEEIFHPQTAASSTNKLILAKIPKQPHISYQDTFDAELLELSEVVAEEIFHQPSTLFSSKKEIINYSATEISSKPCNEFEDIMENNLHYDKQDENEENSNLTKLRNLTNDSKKESLYAKPIKFNKNAKRANFRSSFVMDSRGALMTSSNYAGLRVFVPPKSVDCPARVICKLVKWSKIEKQPQVLYGEQLATHMIKIDFGKFKINKPIFVEVDHGILVKESDEMQLMQSGQDGVWKEATTQQPTTSLSNEYQQAIQVFRTEKNGESPVFSFCVSENSMYAIICRPRRDSFAVGSTGAHLVSNSNTNVQVECPQGAIKKHITIGLQVQNSNVKVAGFSPIVTLHPRKRKFHKLVSLSIPIADYVKADNIRLLCNLSGGPDDWMDVTGTSHISCADATATFVTDVTASFWLGWEDAAQIILQKAKHIYTNLNKINNIFNFGFFARKRDGNEWRLRVVGGNIGENVGFPTLEKVQKFTNVGSIENVSVSTDEKIGLDISGNVAIMENTQYTLNCKPLFLNRVATLLSLVNVEELPAGKFNIRRGGDEVGEKSRSIEFKLPDRRPDPTPQLSTQYSKTDDFGEISLIEMGKSLGEKWIDFAPVLGISQQQISLIQANYSTASQQAFVMLKHWFDENRSDIEYLKEKFRRFTVQEKSLNLGLKVDEVEEMDDPTRRKLSFIDRDVLSVIEEESLTPVDIHIQENPDANEILDNKISLNDISKPSKNVEPIYSNIGDGLNLDRQYSGPSELNSTSDFNSNNDLNENMFTNSDEENYETIRAGQYTGTYNNVHSDITQDINVFDNSIREINYESIKAGQCAGTYDNVHTDITQDVNLFDNSIREINSKELTNLSNWNENNEADTNQAASSECFIEEGNSNHCIQMSDKTEQEIIETNVFAEDESSSGSENNYEKINNWKAADDINKNETNEYVNQFKEHSQYNQDCEDEIQAEDTEDGYDRYDSTFDLNDEIEAATAQTSNEVDAAILQNKEINDDEEIKDDEEAILEYTDVADITFKKKAAENGDQKTTNFKCNNLNKITEDIQNNEEKDVLDLMQDYQTLNFDNVLNDYINDDKFDESRSNQFEQIKFIQNEMYESSEPTNLSEAISGVRNGIPKDVNNNEVHTNISFSDEEISDTSSLKQVDKKPIYDEVENVAVNHNQNDAFDKFDNITDF